MDAAQLNAIFRLEADLLDEALLAARRLQTFDREQNSRDLRLIQNTFDTLDDIILQQRQIENATPLWKKFLRALLLNHRSFIRRPR